MAQSKAAATEYASAPAREGAPADSAAPPRENRARKIIFTGNVTVVCEDLDAAAERLEREIARFGAYIGDANRSGSRGTTREGTWTIRVPSDRFDAFLKFLPMLGEFQSATRQAQDVSEEFYDATARVKNKRVEEVRLVELLKRVAGNLDQILRVEKELSRIREEIESIEGRLRYLENLTALSSVTITLREVKNFKPEGPPTFATRVNRTWTGSLEALAEFGTAVVLLIVGLAPWAVPALVVGAVALAVTRRNRRRRVAVAAPPVHADGPDPMRPV